MNARAISFVALAVLAGYAAQVSRAVAADEKPLAMTGIASPELQPFDRAMTQAIRKHGFPGGSLAVAKNGRLVLARGYGLADVESGAPVEPDSLFRIASLSKPITSAVVLKLVEAKKLDLDAKALDLLKENKPPPGKQLDPRWREITVRQLLHHTAGFDSDKGLDPMCESLRVAKEAGEKSPLGSRAIIRFMLGRPLDFDPGTKYVYSNFGYCVLGRIIEDVTGLSYSDAVKSLVLKPAGIKRMELGKTALSGRLPGEVRYRAAAVEGPCESVFAGVKEKVPAAYGQYCIEAMDSHGGWVASAADMARFATAVDGSRKPGLFKASSIALLESPPAAPLPKDAKHYYGLGWGIVAAGRGANWQHNGRLAGTASAIVRLESGITWVALFNGDDPDDAFYLELDRAMHEAVRQIKRWPDRDLFSKIK